MSTPTFEGWAILEKARNAEGGQPTLCVDCPFPF